MTDPPEAYILGKLISDPKIWYKGFFQVLRINHKTHFLVSQSML